MFRKINWPYTFISATIAALAFCICAFIYINRANYTVSWVLYLGSVSFFFIIATTTVLDNRKRGGDESTVAMVFASHVITILGIILSVIACAALLYVMDPGIFGQGHLDKVMAENPPGSQQGRTGGLVFRVFFAAVVLNFFGGSIAGVTIPFYTKRNQTKDNREPTPFVQKKAADRRGHLK